MNAEKFSLRCTCFVFIYLTAQFKSVHIVAIFALQLINELSTTGVLSHTPVIVVDCPEETAKELEEVLAKGLKCRDVLSFTIHQEPQVSIAIL